MNERIILFDGICNVCNRSVDFVLAKDQQKHFRFVAVQSEKGQQIMKDHALQPDTDSVVFINNKKVFTESDAAVEITKLLPAPWKWLAVLGYIPRAIRNRVYRWIAHHRYALFGKRTTCRSIKN